jgi:predicted RNA-binding protein with TRAM domain
MYIVNLLANTDIPVNSGLRRDVRIEETWRAGEGPRRPERPPGFAQVFLPREPALGQIQV